MRHNLLLKLFGLAAAANMTTSTQAFVLLGPPEAWQTVDLGYRDHFLESVELGEPKLLTEEYRLNTRIVTYGFTPDFFNWFGERGIEEIESAIQTITDIQSFSSLDINDYPLNSIRFNATASQANLFDLRSTALAAIAKNYMGLGNAEFWLYSITDREVLPTGEIAYDVRLYNFDPDTYLPTPYINGDLYTFTGIAEDDQGALPPLNFPVDPLASTTGPLTSFDRSHFEPGWYVAGDGLTRDDAAGLQYLYRRDNFNFETTEADLQLSSSGPGVFPILNQFGGSSGGGAGSSWIPVIPPSTNQVAGGAGGINPTNFVSAAVRPGIDRLRFVRTEYDSSVGGFENVSVSMQDNYVTNNSVRSQNLVKTNTAPDLIFDAGGDPSVIITYQFSRITGPGASQSAANDSGGVGAIRFLNTSTNSANLLPKGGPGTMTPAFALTFAKLTPGVFTINPGASEVNSVPLPLWGTFNGSTNQPVVYPEAFEFDRISDLIVDRADFNSGGSWQPVPAPANTATGNNNNNNNNNQN